jgi:hypothetical protein
MAFMLRRRNRGHISLRTATLSLAFALSQSASSEPLQQEHQEELGKAKSNRTENDACPTTIQTLPTHPQMNSNIKKAKALIHEHTLARPK